MYLEKLQLNGFKSFADLTELKFAQGITAIVGPNGSGKSNISDAVRWVLGEQSMKSIRGKKSEDIIFAGSDKKSRLGMGEVSLYLNNEDQQFPLDYSEIVLTRRFYRSREGEYLLNNSKVRLADIQLLLAKANIGQKTYSVIGQGQIDNVLLATPRERKDFFDEATGVKQYQLKRDEALHKLERAHNNLTQGIIVLNEIEPRLRSLTRQVRRYEQKENIERKLSVLQDYYYYSLWSEYQISQHNLDLKSEKIAAEIITANNSLLQIRKSMEESEGERSREQSFSELQAEYESIQKEKQGYLRELAVLQGQGEVLLQQQGGSDLVFINRRLEELASLIDKHQSEKDQVKINLDKIKEIYRQQSSQQEELKQEFDFLEKKLKEARGTQGQRITFKEVENHLVKLAGKIENSLGILENDNPDDLATVREQLQNVKQEIENLLQQINKGQQQNDSLGVRALEDKISELLLNKDNMVQELADSRAEVRILENRFGVLKSEIEVLKQEQQELTVAFQSQESKKESGQQEKQLEGRIAAIDEKLKDITKRMQGFNKVEQEKKEKLLKAQKELQNQQLSLDKLKQQQNQLEVEKARLETKLEDLALEINREMNVFLASLVDKWQKNKPELDDKYKDVNFAQEIENLKKKKELIGGIEAGVVEEYQEVKQKHDFIKEQTTDLKASINNLISIIKELDEIIAKEFTENFKEINNLFNKYFRILFSGGKAELQLLRNQPKNKEEDSESSEENVTAVGSEQEREFRKILQQATQQLIEGIEIKATPPGKKMKGIGMLSGGERALASIALICAMIANNPSPFVFLDEVDAALDEANSIRFAEIISELSKKTQFVVISHNRATMEKADILYGVTMGGDGISSVLSIKLEQAQEYANRY